MGESRVKNGKGQMRLTFCSKNQGWQECEAQQDICHKIPGETGVTSWVEFGKLSYV